jgi:hypothetical protein
VVEDPRIGFKADDARVDDGIEPARETERLRSRHRTVEFETTASRRPSRRSVSRARGLGRH